MGVKNAFLGRLLASSDKFTDEQVAQTINLLVEHAVNHHASDIHIEPHERFVQVRYRIDNVLRGVHKLPLGALPAVAAQLKEQAHLKTDETHLPQEGQYAVLVNEDQFEIQVYTMPVVGGEKIVLRVSQRLSKPPTLQALGFWGPSLEVIQQALSATHGLIVVATPRRNGKTTTLHSLLQTVNTPTMSVATIEDTIEFRLPGVSQTLANRKHGVTMYDGLQAALNQDPNILMLGAIPDRRTATSLIQAAVSGHLILAGMHADTTSQAISQLQTMSDEDFLFANALKVAISQRLVRRLCGHCRVLYAPERQEIQSVEKAFGITTSVTKQKLHHLEQQAVREDIGDNQTATTSMGIVHLWRASDNGCDYCNHTGYQGSLAVLEIMGVNAHHLDNLLLAPASADKIRNTALKADFIPLELDGLIKALRGQTTLTELLRVFSL